MLKNKNIFFSEKNISDINYLKNEEIKRSSKSYLIKLINSKKKLKILDVGCGTGINSILLNSLGHEVIGVDLSSEAIKKYKKRGFKGYHMDPSKKINFKDNYFDLIFASEVLEHIVDTNTFLSNLKKKLKSDGRLLI